ncbi:VOC family protein [Nodosilinea sp. LEGE 07088]|uniref:VOC family protein n=1 Tax=Nodosilinea sp. LEGE 07088 TaxID=2777968 RepID=UPI0028BEF0E6|nr:VOC family protein [Nodosilinea sp. LEGE 07088]
MAESAWGCARAFITLASPDVEGLVGFYSALLGQPAQPYQRDRYAEFQLPGLRLAIFRPKPDQASLFAAPSSGAMSLCLEVTDLDAAIARLTQLGYPPPGSVLTASHGREIYAYDPDGSRLILHQSFGGQP